MMSAVLSSMRGWGIVLGMAGALGLAVACKPKRPPQPPDPQDVSTTNDASPDADTPVQSPTAGDGATASDGGTPVPDGPTSADPECAAKGEPWDGNPQGCLYEHDGCCYPDPGSVCAAAGCEGDACQILETSPAQARC